MTLTNKQVLVVGLGRSGESSARFLHQIGALVSVADQDATLKEGQVAHELEKLGIKLHLGPHSDGTFTDADLIVLSPGIPHMLEPIKKARDAGIPVIGEIELASRFVNCPILAVTGTNGKTTTTTLIGQMLEKSGLNVFVGGNIGTPLIDYPLNAMDKDVAVIEISSFQLDTIQSFRPKFAVLLNVSPDHQDRYPDFDAYLMSKMRIFENQKGEDRALINGNDPVLSRLSAPENIKWSFFSNQRNSAGDQLATITKDTIDIWPQTDRTVTFDLTTSKLLGKHNHANLCAAAASAMLMGGQPRAIQSVINTFPGLAHRLQYVATIKGIRFYNDSKATNVDAVKNALASFKTPGVLIMGGRNKGGDLENLADDISSHVQKIIAIGEARSQITRELGSIVPVITKETMEEAVAAAYSDAAYGEFVLLSPACASFDMFADYAERGNAFCQAARQLS